MSKPRLIAFYLPQYYPTPENDEWWEPGFTEWTNVARAKPLFKGHYQPRIPRDLGFYDLRVPETREKQAQLARGSRIEGFCYWHYWFGNGKRLLSDVFEEVVTLKKPNFPFCLCWANHSWYQKTWDPTKPDKLLIEQTYPGREDYISHFYAMLPAFKDERYIKVKGKLLFGCFAASDIPDFIIFKNTWNELAKQNGLEGFYFFGFTFNKNEIGKIHQMGYDATCYDGVRNKIREISFINRVKRKIFNIPFVTQYSSYVDDYIQTYKLSETDHPCIDPNFDHSPRSAHRGTILDNSTPIKWKEFCKQLFEICKYRETEENLVFIKAWNEWGEGNYLEPDSKYGCEYINKLKEAYDEV